MNAPFLLSLPWGVFVHRLGRLTEGHSCCWVIEVVHVRTSNATLFIIHGLESMIYHCLVKYITRNLYHLHRSSLCISDFIEWVLFVYGSRSAVVQFLSAVVSCYPSQIFKGTCYGSWRSSPLFAGWWGLQAVCWADEWLFSGSIPWRSVQSEAWLGFGFGTVWEMKLFQSIFKIFGMHFWFLRDESDWNVTF